VITTIFIDTDFSGFFQLQVGNSEITPFGYESVDFFDRSIAMTG
tara:strand:- start:182 stop:313 length:132 start_codon:yes stop_codon:yes gene_type:complete